MSDREILLRWLTAAAGRLGWSLRLRALGELACALAALCLLPEVLEIFGVPPPVLSALTSLLIFAALGVTALTAWRLATPASLAHAAGTADSRAGLKDQVRSAHWFAQNGARDSFVELLVARAARAVEQVEPRTLFPLATPRSVPTALALILCTGLLAWFSPRLTWPVAQDGGAAAAGIARGNAPPRMPDNEVEKAAGRLPFSDRPTNQDLSTLWPQLEELAQELPAAQRETLRRAATARDTRLVAQILQALPHSQAVAAEQTASARPDADETSAAAAGGARRAPQGLDQAGEAPSQTPRSPPGEAAARVRQQMNEQIREERRKLEGQPAQGEVTLNNRLRAVSRNSAKQREVAYGEGQAGDAGANTTVDGAAAGERTGKSRSGGSEGEHPLNGPTGDSEPDAVLGERTVRLEADVQRMRLEGDGGRPPQETEEAFYAATQRQASRVGLDSVAAQWRRRSESTVAASRTPLEYRAAVKRYFLTQHERED